MSINRKVEVKIFNEILLELGGIPARGSEGAAAFDLRSCEADTVVLKPGDQYKFKLGFGIYIRDNSIAAKILPRSGLGSKGLSLANTVGLIDSDYQGELMAVANWNPKDGSDLVVKPGDRLFQLLFIPIVIPSLMMVDDFADETARGEGGYGSTGV